jgi:GH43 family beta-xylosidase
MLLKDRLAKELADIGTESDDFTKVRSVVEETTAAITAAVANDRLQVGYEVGLNVNYGLQHNVFVRTKDGRFKDIVYRAYIPIDGLPVRLDFLEERLATCTTMQELEDAVAAFFQTPALKTRLAMYRRI